jgi:glycosyltransferase involved in cell wall biosynthesis
MTTPVNSSQIIILSIFLLCTSIQLFYYFYYYLGTAIYKPGQPDGKNVPVSVIICAKNESDNLRNFLPGVLEQDYPSGFEVIVVNDCSEDDTAHILEELQEQYPHLKVSTIIKDIKFTHNKKLAQVIGIKAASNEILLFTDADCQPESNKWLERMTAHFDDKTVFVLGYGGYLHEEGLLNKYIRYDSMFIAMQYLGMALKKTPYMGVGRNLAYRRSMFFENKGFSSHSHLMSGDDDLFVNSNANGKNTKVEFGKGTHTRSVPAMDKETWIKQKRRHLTTGNYYKLKDKIRLIAEPVTRAVFYISMICLLCMLLYWPFIIALFCLRLIVQTTVFFHVMKKLNERDLLFYSIIFDIFSPVIYSTIYISNLRGRTGSNTWK